MIYHLTVRRIHLDICLGRYLSHIICRVERTDVYTMILDTFLTSNYFFPFSKYIFLFLNIHFRPVRHALAVN